MAESVEFPERYYRGNVVGTLNLLDAMRAAGVPAAGLLLDGGDLRRAGRRADHRGRAQPAGQHVRNSKLTIDRMLADEARAHGLAAVSLRYFNVAGASGALGEDHTPRRT